MVDSPTAVVCHPELLTNLEANIKKSEVQFKVNTVPPQPKAAEKFVLLNHEKIKIREGTNTKCKTEYTEFVKVRHCAAEQESPTSVFMY